MGDTMGENLVCTLIQLHSIDTDTDIDTDTE